MSKVPEILRSKLLQVALGFAAGAATYVTVEQHQAPSPEVQLAMEIGAHYESSGRHIGKPYRDVIGKGQPWTVCNGVTGPEVDPAKYYTPEDCKRLELPKYLAAERAARRMFVHWGTYNVWVRASLIDMLYNLGEATVAASTLLQQANAGQPFEIWCPQMQRFVYGTVGGKKSRLDGLAKRRDTTAELCRDWGRDGHFSAQVRAEKGGQ